jgi:DNA-binding transcriptional MerR regulator
MTATVDDALDRLRRQDASVPQPGTTLSIAEMAQRTGITAHTLRYYERIGLLDVARDAGGHRVYDAGDFARVVFLTRLRMTGMPIRDLKRYVALVAGGEATVPERLAMLEHHRDAIRIQLMELQVALETVEFKITSYGGACAP